TGAGIAINFIVALCVFFCGIVLALFMRGSFGLKGASAQEVTRALFIMSGASGLTLAAYSFGSPLMALQRALEHGVVYVGGTIAARAATAGLVSAGWGIASMPAGLLVRSLVWFAGWGVILFTIVQRDKCLRPEFNLRHARELTQLSGYTFVAKACAALQS